MFAHVLVPIDGWPASDRAVLVALRMAKALSSEVGFCHVVRFSESDETGADERNVGETMLAVAMSKARAAGVSATSEMLSGEFSDVILKKAREIAADLIVVGTTGRSGLEKLVLGSVSEAIVRKSPVPVVVVRADTAVSREAQPIER